MMTHKSVARKLVSKVNVLFIVALVAGLALVAGPMSRAAASTTVTVKPSALNGWSFLLESGAGAGDFVVGPATAPLGQGSAHLTTSSSDGGILIGAALYAGTRLDSITNLEYSTYQSMSSSSTVQAISLQFSIDNDVTDGDNDWKGRLVFEPYYTETIVKGGWQTWDPQTQGKWWGTGVTISAFCSIGSPCTWAQVLSNFPNVGIHSVFGAVLFKAGSGWPAGFDGNVDAFTIGVSGSDTTYDFEPETPCIFTCYVDAVNGNDAFGGGSPANAKKTIQAGINAVSAGGTVIVAPGTYDESPNISKSLTLQSSGGRDVTTINLQPGPTYLGGLTIDAPTVTVDGFTILGFDAVGGGLASSNIVVTTAPDNVLIQNNRVRVGAIGAGSNGDDGMGLITYYNTTSDVDTLTVVNNIFEPLNASGTRAFFINPGVNHFVFRQNQITGNFTRTAITQAKDGLVEENTVAGTGPAGSRSRGLGTWGYPDPAVYGHTMFRQNTISNTSTGVAIFETEKVVIENNFFYDDDYGVWAGTSVPLAFDVSTIHVNGNSLLNSANNGVEKNVSVAGVLDASGNWWGDNTPTGVAGEVSTGVDYTPWLDVSTDTDDAPGFQGDFSYLHVDDNSPQTGSVGRIQEGVNLVAASTVHVVAGTYIEQVAINDSLTMFGDGALSTFIVAPSTIPAASNPDSTIVKITGAGVDVEMYGFTVTGPGPSGCGSIGVGIFVRDGAHASIHDNRILDIRDNHPSGDAPFSGCQNGVGILVGRNLLDTSGSATIVNNLVEGYQKGGVVVDNTGSSADITGNTVTGYGPTVEIAQNGIQISRGATALVQGNTVSGNNYPPISWVACGLLYYQADGVRASGNTKFDNERDQCNFGKGGGNYNPSP